MPAPLMTLRPLGEERCAWVLETDDRLQSGEAGWDALPRPAESTRVRLLVPGDHITHAAVRLAARNPKLIDQALPFALEEQLAEDIEALHIAHGPRDAGGLVPARIVRRKDLDSMLDRLRQHGIVPQGVYSELDALPVPAQGWVTLAWDNIVLARGSEGQALALEPELLNAALGEDPVQTIATPEGPLPWLHRHLREGTAINLFGERSATGLAESLRPWRIPAAIAATALLLHAGLMLYDTSTLEKQRAAMQADIERMAREAAPEINRWINPIAQLRQMAGGGAASQAEAGMLDLLAKLAPALAARPDIKLGNLRFQGDTLEAQLSAGDGSGLEALLGALNKEPGLKAELAEQRVEGGQASARLRLKGGQA